MNNVTFLFFASIIALSCSTQGRMKNSSYACFDVMRTLLQNDSIKSIDFSKTINCFEWDSLELAVRGSYENHPEIEFALIDNRHNRSVFGREIETVIDWFDRDRHWQMIYFYHNGKKLNQALAISEVPVSFRQLRLTLDDNFFSILESKFTISDRIVGGISGNEIIEHRQMKKSK